MPGDEDTPGRRRSLDKGRMEAFSDGTFGFASTLLVVDLALHPPGTALQQLLHAWPSFLAYTVSFLTISMGWLAHTGLTDRLARTDSIFLRLDLLLLLVVAFVPFPTRLPRWTDAAGTARRISPRTTGAPWPGYGSGPVRTWPRTAVSCAAR